MNNIVQRLWRAVYKNNWKYASRTEDPELPNKVALAAGVSTGFGSMILTAYHMDDWKVDDKDRRTPFIHAWYMSGSVGFVVGFVNSIVVYMPWTAIAFYGTGVPVWAVRKYKSVK